MNKKLFLKFGLGLISLGLLAVVIVTPIVVINEKNSMNKYNKEVISKNNTYINNQNSLLDSNGLPSLVDGANNTEKTTNLKLIYDNANKAKTELTTYLKDNKDNLTSNGVIWCNTYITQWDILAKNIQNGSIFMGANPISGVNILSTSSNNIAGAISKGINIYKINPETGDPGTDIDKNLVSNFKTNIINATNFIKVTKEYLTIGSSYGISPASIHKKLLVNQIMQKYFSDNIDVFDSSGENTTIAISGVLNLTTSQGFFDKLKTNIAAINGIDKTSGVLIDNLKNALVDFLIYYSGEYYTKKSFGPAVTLSLSLSKTDNQEVEKTIIANEKNPVYGLGLTEADLNQTNVGIGFMTTANNDITGNKMYEQLLYNNNAVETKAATIYADGLKATLEGSTNMKNVVKELQLY